MTRDEFIQEYYDNIGEIPDEATVRDFMSSQESELPGSSNDTHNYSNSDRQYTFNHARNEYEDLLGEVRGIYKDLCSSAKSRFESSKDNLNESEQLDEFFRMSLIFLCKSCLYFLLQNGYKNGYDFRNL